MELQEQESADCNLCRSRLIPGQVSCRLWLPVPPLTAWPSPLPPNRLNSFTQEEETQVSRSNWTHSVPDAVGIRTHRRAGPERSADQTFLLAGRLLKRHLRSCTNIKLGRVAVNASSWSSFLPSPSSVAQQLEARADGCCQVKVINRNTFLCSKKKT